ncbi:nucleotidyltransferase domain-containing protein [Candidatus Woesearchaeota archaeon]|nr:nucleotidyltransferase domain-containing protein [Candidatus Woesearchaeota archaeon]
MGRKKNIDKLKDFKKELSKEIRLDKVILFGSRARGKPTRYSDFDLILVSPSFRRKKSFQRGIGLYKYWHLNYPVDFLCYTPEEFNKLKKQITIVREAVKEGIEIK